MVKILLVDDHALLRQGLENILKAIPDFNIVGSVPSGEDAINFCNEKKPDLILMDIMMKGMSGLEATKWIKDQHDDIKIILVSSEVSEDLVKKAMACKANGYIPKNEDKDVIIDAIRTVLKGKPYFSKEITDMVFQSYFQEQTGNRVKKRSAELTQREEEVLERIAMGLSNAEIGEELFISIKTVESHKANILSKLGLKNTADLTRYAIKQGYISLD
ncbi:MAG: response regulator [Candidatus Cyclobacteriaceae bacterium M2_1C_046]